MNDNSNNSDGALQAVALAEVQLILQLALAVKEVPSLSAGVTVPVAAYTLREMLELLDGHRDQALVRRLKEQVNRLLYW